MKYADYIKKVFAEINERNFVFHFEEVEEIIPPIMNKQRWFVIKRKKQPLEGQKEFPKEMGYLLYLLRQYYRLSSFPVLEYEIIERSGATSYRLKSVYLLDFNLPVGETKKFKSLHSVSEELAESLRYMLSVYKNQYLPGDLTIYDVPIISRGSAYEVAFSDIEKTVKEGHYLVFEFINKDYYHFAFHPPEEITFFLYPDAYHFYYINGKVKHIAENGNRIDNMFLQKCGRVLSLMSSNLSKIPKIFNGRVVNDKMEMEIKTKTETIQLSLFFSEGKVKSIEAKLGEVSNDRWRFINKIEDIVKYIWFKIFDEEIIFSDDLDVKLKEMEDRMLFMKEALDFVR